jgi:DEAD/DEAH box helicase domain-containing protein
MSSTLLDALQELCSNPRFCNHITAWRHLSARPARYGATPAGLHAHVLSALQRQGIEKLYSHQARAIGAVLRGEDVAVVSGAASGKTLCYNLPVLDALARDHGACALYLFPTKALAQDQLAAWQGLSEGLLPSTVAATYDGDTPSSARSRIRQDASLLITNPDMLHLGILGHHTRWESFFAGLKYIVLDEVHIYRGLFGSHVANLLRRLRRICEFYGSAPRFICCSATIANPQQFALQLLGRPVTLVGDDGSPQGEKHFLLYNPPVVNMTRGIRRGLILEAALVADLFLARDLPTITFGRGRLATELLLTYLRRAARKRGQPARRLRGYRGGYLPRERREIERGLRNGKVHGVVSTNALELGVDIGELSVCVLAGYPGTIASTWQQAGRAGRRRAVSAVVLVGGLSALDQYLLTHPQFLFGRTCERALMSPDNPFVLQSHLKCAAFELPIGDAEEFAEGVDSSGLLGDIQDREGVLRHTGKRWYWMSSHYPAQSVSLRTAAADQFVLCKDDGEVIGQMDSASAPLLVYPGAVYLHEGQAYRVTELDWDAHIARVIPTEADHFTEVAVSVKVEVLAVERCQSMDGLSRANAEVRICTRTSGYREFRLYTHEQLATVPLNLPEQELLTHAYWLEIHDEVVQALRDEGDWTIAPILSYGPNWATQRQRARERDGLRCRNCGRPELPEREHDVHHLRPFRIFDYRPGENTTYLLANRLANLITLCPECHHRVEAVQSVQGTLQGLGNVVRALAPLFLMCDPQDLRLTTDLDFPYTRAPTVIVYDAAPGGVGFSKLLYEAQDDLLRACMEWVSDCPCAEGCPVCVGAPPQAGAGAKARVGRLLERITDRT